MQNKCLKTITGAYKTTNVRVLEHEVSVTPLDLHLEAVALGHVRRAEKSAGEQAVGVTCKAVRSTDLAPLSDERKYSCKTRRPIPKKSCSVATAIVPGRMSQEQHGYEEEARRGMESQVD